MLSRHEVHKQARVIFTCVSDMAENDEPQIYKKRYKIDKKLGAGNFGTAYLVTDAKIQSEP